MKNRKILSLITVFSLSVAISACANSSQSVSSNGMNQATASNTFVQTTQSTPTSGQPVTNSNILIAYFTVPEDIELNGVDAVAGASVVVKDSEKLGNTEYVARHIQQTVGGDLFRIETVQDYPLEHDKLVDFAAEEQNKNARPELSNHVEDFSRYDYVFLGFPNWWGDMPQPVYTFLEEYDFGAKNIIPFITHGGSGASQTIRSISGIQPGALMSDNALMISRNDVRSSEQTVTQWAEGLGITAASF